VVALDTIRIATTFMLDPYIPLLLRHLGERGYVTARVKPSPEAVNIIAVEPPDVIAVKGQAKISYNFARRTLVVEAPSPKEAIGALGDVEEALKSMDMVFEKALVPLEAAVMGTSRLAPKFSSTAYELPGLGLRARLAEVGLAMEGGDPNANRWFYAKISPLYSSYKPGGESSLYQILIIYRDTVEKVKYFLEHLEEALREISERV
jgi:hypothetical protein